MLEQFRVSGEVDARVTVVLEGAVLTTKVPLQVVVAPVKVEFRSRLFSCSRC